MPENKRTIGYLCPVCGKAVVVERSEFQLGRFGQPSALPLREVGADHPTDGRPL